MTTSASSDFALVTNELIEEAYSLIGVASEGTGISAYQYAQGRRSLNLIAKDWAAKERLWTRTEGTKALVAATASYALTPKPLRVLSVRRRTTASGTDLPLRMLSRQDYYDLPNKTSAGAPNCFYYDPQRASGTLYVWPVPATADASAYSLIYTYLRTLEDFDGSSDDPDLPQEWLRALSYTLAAELALKHGRPPEMRAEINARAAAHVAEMEGWDNETTAIFLVPDERWC